MVITFETVIGWYFIFDMHIQLMNPFQMIHKLCETEDNIIPFCFTVRNVRNRPDGYHRLLSRSEESEDLCHHVNMYGAVSHWSAINDAGK